MNILENKLSQEGLNSGIKASPTLQLLATAAVFDLSRSNGLLNNSQMSEKTSRDYLYTRSLLLYIFKVFWSQCWSIQRDSAALSQFVDDKLFSFE